MSLLDYDLESGITRDVIILAVSALLLLAFVAFVTLLIKRNKGLNTKYFQARWEEVLALAGDKKTIIMAVIEADKLMDQALIRSQFKGKTMGERLISASTDLSDQDGIWRAHKLRNRIVHEEGVKPKKAQVRTAMVGYKRALKDLGALR